MRVLLSAYACEPNRGSEPGNGWNWSVSLARLNLDVTVLTRIHGREAIERECRKEHLPNLHFLYVQPTTRVCRIMKGQAGVYAHYVAWQKRALQAAEEVVMRKDIDIVHHVTWTSLTGGTHLWKLGRPFIFGPVGGGQVAPYRFSGYIEGYWTGEFFRSMYLKHLAGWNFASRKAVKNSSRTLAANTDTYNLLCKLGAGNVTMFFDTGLPLASYPETLERPRESEQLRLLWVGRLLPRKGIRLAIAAISELDIPFTLTVLGDGPVRAELLQYIREYRVGGKVDWRGQVPWTEVQRAYQEHDVLLFTSLRDSCGVQMLEAMAAGLTVIVLDHHGARDWVPDAAGIKVPVTTPEQTVSGLRSAIRAVAANPARRAEMGKAGFEFARTQSWPERARRMAGLYDEVIRHAGQSKAAR